MPPDLTLLTFSRWHGTVFAVTEGTQQWPGAVHQCLGGHQEQFYLVRVANNADPSDLPHGAAAPATGCASR